MYSRVVSGGRYGGGGMGMGEGEVQQVFYQTGGAMTGGSGRSSMGVSNGGGVSPLLLVTPYQERSRQFGEMCEPSSSRVCEEGTKGKDKDDGGGGLLLGEEDEHEDDVRRGGGSSSGLSGRVGLGISSLVRSEEEGGSTTMTIMTTSSPPPPSPPPPLKPMVSGGEERLPGTVVPDDDDNNNDKADDEEEGGGGGGGGGDRFPSIDDERDTHARIGEQSRLVNKDSFEGELTRKGEAE